MSERTFSLSDGDRTAQRKSNPDKRFTIQGSAEIEARPFTANASDDSYEYSHEQRLGTGAAIGLCRAKADHPLAIKTSSVSSSYRTRREYPRQTYAHSASCDESRMGHTVPQALTGRLFSGAFAFVLEKKNQLYFARHASLG